MRTAPGGPELPAPEGESVPSATPGASRAPERPGGPPAFRAPAFRAPESRAPAPRFEPLRDAVRAEWTKVWTLPGTRPLLGALVLLTVALGAVAAATVSFHPGTDAAKVSLTGVQLGEAVAAVLGAAMIAGEHSTGMLGSTFAAMPRRGTVLAAKAAVLAAMVLPAALLSVGGSLLAGRLLLPAAARPALSATDGSVLRAGFGSALCLVLVALLALGTAAAVRDPGTSIGAVLALLYLFPITAALVADPHWQRHLQQIGPSSAGLAVQTTVPAVLHTQPIGPWAGLGVLACWAGAALLAGTAVLRARDA
ncbi:ABC transporter permease [Streptomyces sp. NBC_00669]|uniref:ABC transporter permease n=1 Tax=Streptomyces sp. NBC_00669 TaxID=2976011 RepID=UPI002E35526E|nr:ABC transporter permease [Streptomyces sp. NBC_00669]